MRVELLDGPAQFLDRTRELRSREPVLSNILGTVAQSVRDGRAYERCWWWLVCDDAGSVVGCALRTAPWNLVVGPMSVDAAAALGRAVSAEDGTVPAVTGPADAVRALVAELPGPPSTRVRMTDVVYVLDRLADPAPVPGLAVDARIDEMQMLADWHRQFARDAGLPLQDEQAAVRQRLETGSIMWWKVDDEPVSMAAHAQPMEGPGGLVGRIGPVFTPERFRRRGYGAAVTAAIARRLLERRAVVMLYADAANPTSNGLYERLGFRRVAEVVEVELTSSAPSAHATTAAG